MCARSDTKRTCAAIVFRQCAGVLAQLIAPSAAIGSAIASSVGSFWLMFAGFLVPRPTMPPWWRWLFYTSPLAWAIEAQFVSQLGDKVRAAAAAAAAAAADHVKWAYSLRKVCAVWVRG